MKKFKGLTLEQIKKIDNKKVLFNKNTRTKKEFDIDKRRFEINSFNKTKKDQYSNDVDSKKYEISKNVSSVYSVPRWFENSRKHIEVSIIVPLYKSSEVIKKQIKNWPISDFAHSIEIIYVDDKCPLKSYQSVIDSWKDIVVKDGIGKIILNDTNCGYAKSCNIGSKYAKGKYLIFLNADCEVTENWIYPMINLLKKDKKIGIVGNMQIKDDILESAGSEWNWEWKSFLHIGKSTFENQLLKLPFNKNKIPEKLKNVEEREMVTGCCFAMPSNIFYDLGGFDEEFLVGYWEDSDLCLRVRNSGYKILFQPQSIIYHDVGHTKSGNHAFKFYNFSHFSKRWIETGRIDDLVKAKRTDVPPCSIKKNINGKVVGCIIACNEEEFLEASADSISSIVDEYIIVVGGNEYAYKAEMCNEKGYPNDNTLEISRKIIKKYGGTLIEPPNRLWKDKIEMRNAYAQKLKPGNWMFMLDGDEVYKNNQLWRIIELMKLYECLILQFWTFWNKINIIGTKVWDQYPQERIVKWKQGYKYSDSHLFVSGHNGFVNRNVPTYKGSEKLYYHYSWIRPLKKIIQKREYYKYQSNKFFDNYINDIFLKWRENPNDIKETHPFGGGGWEEFKGIHPESIQKMIEEKLLNF